MDKRRAGWILAGCIALAAAARLVNLTAYSLWNDEAYTLNVASRDWAQVLADHDQTPPLFALALHAWTLLAGTSDLAVRLLPVLAGVATVPVVERLARRFVPREGALVAAALASLHLYLVIVSQEARAYALLAFLLAASTLTWLRLGERWSAGRAAAHAVVSALLLYTHVYAVFALAAQGIDLLLRRPRPFPRWLATLAAPALLFLPWVPVVLGGAQRVADGFWIETPGWDDAFWTLYVLAGGWGGAAVLALAGVAGAAWGRRRFAVSEAGPAGAASPRILWLTLACFVLLPFLVSFAYPLFTPRYTVPAAIPLLVLAVRGLWGLRPPLRRRLAALALAGAFAQLALFAAGGQGEDSRQDWTGAARLVEALAPPGSVLVFSKGSCDSSTDADLSCAYARVASRRDLRLVPFFFEDRGVSKPVNATTVQELDGLVAGAPEAWLLYSYSSDAGGLGPSRLADSGWTLSGHWHLKRIELWRYVAPAAPAA